MEKDKPNVLDEEVTEPSADIPSETEVQDVDTEVTASDSPTPVATTEPTPTILTTKNKPRLWKRLFTDSPHKRRNLLVLGVVVILVAGGVAALLLTHHKAQPTPHHKPTTSTLKVIVPNQTISQTSFLSVPVQISDLHFFKDYSLFGTECSGSTTTNCPNAVSDSDLAYYKIGTTADGQSIVVASDSEHDENAFTYVAVSTSSGGYKILGLLDTGLVSSLAVTNGESKQYITQFSNALSSNVSLDTTTTISQLSFPNDVTVAGLPLETAINSDTSGTVLLPAGFFLRNGLVSIRGNYFAPNATTAPASTIIGSQDGHTYYEVTAEDQPSYAVKEIYATVNNVYAASYIVKDNLVNSDGSTPLAANWTSGNNTSANYYDRSQGCGSADGYVIAKGIDNNSLVSEGTGPDGQTLYQIPTSSDLFTEIYNTDYNQGQNLQDSSLEGLSAQQFQDDHGAFLAKNGLGELVVYLRSDMIDAGGCGKPVVYLYPQSPTKVNVQVGARVEKSDPTYTSVGWQNVLALPGSHLFYQGKGYNSLYWEGLGNGTYPAITSGIVVPSSQAVSTIRHQLSEQGLTTSETNDFMAYWQPRLPKTAYVRLSWLTTAQMNALAPLSITPRPTTLLRVFLDFQGLQQPKPLPAQHFSAPARNGFTVVEWGGLLHGTSN